jgi:hypothetical protein
VREDDLNKSERQLGAEAFKLLQRQETLFKKHHKVVADIHAAIIDFGNKLQTGRELYQFDNNGYSDWIHRSRLNTGHIYGGSNGQQELTAARTIAILCTVGLAEDDETAIAEKLDLTGCQRVRPTDIIKWARKRQPQLFPKIKGDKGKKKPADTGKADLFEPDEEIGPLGVGEEKATLSLRAENIQLRSTVASLIEKIARFREKLGYDTQTSPEGLDWVHKATTSIGLGRDERTYRIERKGRKNFQYLVTFDDDVTVTRPLGDVFDAVQEAHDSLAGAMAACEAHYVANPPEPLDKGEEEAEVEEGWKEFVKDSGLPVALDEDITPAKPGMITVPKTVEEMDKLKAAHDAKKRAAKEAQRPSGRSYMIRPIGGQRGYLVEYWIGDKMQVISAAEVSVESAKQIIGRHRAQQPADGRLVWESIMGENPVGYGQGKRRYNVTKMRGRFTVKVHDEDIDGQTLGVYNTLDEAKAAAQVDCAERGQS